MSDAVHQLISEEADRQRQSIPLIASENFCSSAVREAVGSVFTNKYAEGKPGQRYYAGNQTADKLERLAVQRTLELLVPSNRQNDWHANVQPLSGSPANLAVYAALLQPGERILSMALPAGGHLSHGHRVTLPGQLYDIHSYSVDATTELLDYEAIAAAAREVQPRLIIAGASAYPREIDFARFAAIAHEVGAYLLADISHVAGLIVGGVHPSPIPHADVVTTTTHKTLRGPRGALIICRNELSEAIDRGVFPGVQGGPHLNQIAGIAVALEEAASEDFRRYAAAVVANAQAMAAALTEAKVRLITGGTDNHLLLADVTSLGLTGGEAQQKLEQAGIIANANSIPFDTRSPRNPSGLRLGTAAVTTLDATPEWCRQCTALICQILRDEITADDARAAVQRLRSQLTAAV